MKLKRKKVGDRAYELVDTQTGEVIASAANTGSHLDDYPWDWYLADGLHFGGVKGFREGGSAENLKGIVDKIESIVNTYGMRRD